MKLFSHSKNSFAYSNRISLSKLIDLCQMPATVFDQENFVTNCGILYNHLFVDSRYMYAKDTYTATVSDGVITEGPTFNQSQSVYIKGKTVFTVNNNIFRVDEPLELTVDNLDTGTEFVLGTDYYVYICDPSNGNIEEDIDEVYLISANSSYPEGYDESNSRKIGGFHYGRCRWSNEEFYPVGTNAEVFGTNWMTNVYIGIVPNSVWTLLHRPMCNPEGMVWLWGNLWGDIYLSSDNGNYGLQSVKAKAPMSGTESMNWYGLIERAANVNKRLPTYSELAQAALGTPPGANNNTYNHTSSSNSGRCNTGNIANAVSSYNVCDMVGSIYKWTTNITDAEASGAYTCAWKNAQSNIQTGGLITTVGCGDYYSPVNTSIKAIRGGGSWGTSTNAGSRCLVEDYYPWIVNANTACWCVCKALHNERNAHIFKNSYETYYL